MPITINEQVLEQSKEEALRLCHMTRNLKFMKKVDYNDRRDSFEGLVTSEGYTIFKPFVTISVVEDFKKMFQPTLRNWSKKSLLEEDEEKSKEYNNMYKLAGYFHDRLTNEDIINGVVPPELISIAKQLNIKGFNSPKLSRALVKLCSEKSKFWSWYTNVCPKEIVMGEDKNKNVVISTLPHHIAGMSYYSSYNFGGKQWSGWQGTSCQDPKRNNGGQAMFNLPSSIKDETLAVAYLSDGLTHDIWKPVYEARILIRSIELSNGKVIYIALRPFGYKESIAYLTDALKNKFPGILFTADEVRTYSRKRGNTEIRIKTKVKDIRFESKRTCGNCDGEGREYGSTCEDCDGTGYSKRGSGDHYLPYNDDSDIWSGTSNGTVINFTVPKLMLVEAGVCTEQEVV